MSAIAITDLTKRYGSFTAVDDVTLHVAQGSVCGLLGPNGAGKTTTFLCLLNFARANAGTIAIDGAPVGPATFEKLAYVPERATLYEWLTVGENIAIARDAYTTWDEKRAKELLALFALDEKKKARKLSKGQQTAVGLILAFARRPAFLVLDEPASGLDPLLQRAVLDLVIDAAANGATVLFSSHQIGQVERAADCVAIMRHGKLVLQGDIDTLKASEKSVEAVVDGVDLTSIERDPHVRRVERVGTSFARFACNGGADALAERLSAAGAQHVRVLDRTLEDIFVEAVGAPATAVVA
jgi:ABC-2 type transport system ATP-binding protein